MWIVRAVIFVPKRHLLILESQQALIAEGDAVRVASEVFDDLFGAAKGWFGINDPFGLTYWSQVLLERLGITEQLELTMKFQFSFGVSALQGFQKEAAEQTRQNTDTEEEVGPAGDPLVIRRQAAAGDDAVQVGMEQKVLAPGMEDGEEPQPHPDVWDRRRW